METAITNVVNKLNAVIRSRIQDVRDISVENGDERYILAFSIGPAISISWELFKAANFVKMRCDARMQGKSEDELTEIGIELAPKLGGETMDSVNGDCLTFQNHFPVPEDGAWGDGDERDVFNTSMAFIHMIAQNASLLGGGHMDVITDDGELGDLDPFGYDDIDLEEDMPTDEGTAEEAEPGGEYGYIPEPEAKPEPESTAGPEPGPEAAQSGKRRRRRKPKRNPKPGENPTEELAAGDEAGPGTSGPGIQPESMQGYVPAQETPEPGEAKKELGPAPEAVGDDALDSKIEMLVNSAMTDTYNPDGYGSVDITDEELDMLTSLTNMEDAGAAELTLLRDTGEAVGKTIKDVCYRIADVHQQVQDAIERVAEASGSIFIREKEVAAREAGIEGAWADLASKREVLQKDQQEFLDMRGKFEEEKQVLVDYAETLKKMSADCEAVQADNKAKDEEIAALTAERDSARKELQDLMDGEAGGTPVGQAYLKELRKKVIFQDTYIKKADSRTAEFVALVKELQGQLKEARAAAEAKAGAKTAEEVAAAVAAAVTARDREWADKASKAEASLKDRVAKLEKEKKSLEEKLKEKPAADEGMEERYDMLEERYEALEEELAATASKLQAAEMEAETLRGELEEAGKAGGQAATEDPAEAAAALCNSLKEMGINMEPVAGEAKLMYSGEIQNCTVSLDAGNRMLFVTKQLHKAKRAVKDLDRLNAQNIQTAYILTGNEVACKAAVFDFSKAQDLLLSILKEMVAFE